MTTDPLYSITGNETEKIDVRLSYRIVRLFSEGLYASPNKAIEELVANSFDAGARSLSENPARSRERLERNRDIMFYAKGLPNLPA